MQEVIFSKLYECVAIANSRQNTRCSQCVTLSLLVSFELIRSVLYFQGVFCISQGLNLTVSALLTAHHIIDLPAKKKVSAVSVFPLCCLNLVCKKATSRIMRVRNLTCLNKHFSTTQTVLGIFCKLGRLVGCPGHSFCNNCSRHPNIEK